MSSSIPLARLGSIVAATHETLRQHGSEALTGTRRALATRASSPPFFSSPPSLHISHVRTAVPLTLLIPILSHVDKVRLAVMASACKRLPVYVFAHPHNRQRRGSAVDVAVHRRDLAALAPSIATSCR